MRSWFYPKAIWLGNAILMAGMVSPLSAEEPMVTGSIPGAVAGPATGLPIPRFVSLKPSDTPMREGPSKDHAVKWIFKREGLPVEITAEFDNWRRIRDSEGAEGWVYHTRLSGRRTVMIMARGRQKAEPVALYASAGETSSVPARLEPGVIATLDTCSNDWCLIRGEGFNGYIRREKLWGVYNGSDKGK